MMKSFLEDAGYLLRHFFVYVLRHGHYKPRSSADKSS
jgi:hypothetical protein